MKTLILTITSVLFLNTLIVKSSPTDIEKCRKDAHNQIVSILSSSDIRESGSVTIYFYVFNRSVRIKRIEGSNPVLNIKVKELIESTGFSKKGLSGYYMVIIKMNGGKSSDLSLESKIISEKFMVNNIKEFKNQPL